jgi:hypothetical protein
LLCCKYERLLFNFCCVGETPIFRVGREYCVEQVMVCASTQLLWSLGQRDRLSAIADGRIRTCRKQIRG